MFQIQDTLVSSEIVDEVFVCNILACKGQCCVTGDAGAPLEEEEPEILESVYPKIKPYLSSKSVEAIESQNLYIKGFDGDWETPLVEGKECAYATFEASGVVSCAIEKAYEKGIIDWKKPMSCHLYPVRLKKYANYTAVNYDRWDICNAACDLGGKLKIPIYKFLKEALIRKFGMAWHDDLETLAKEYKSCKEAP